MRNPYAPYPPFPHIMPTIQASKCANCGKSVVPPRATCPFCKPGKGAVSQQMVEARGKVLSFTTMELVPEGFTAPRTVAIVELECGARVMCLCAREPKMDETVQLEERDGQIIVV